MNSIRSLLENHVDVNAQVRNCDTPLMLASTSFRTEAVRLLLAADADPSLCDSYGLTPLDYAGNYEPIKDVFLEKSPLLESKTPQEHRSKSKMRSDDSCPKTSAAKTEKTAKELGGKWAIAS